MHATETVCMKIQLWIRWTIQMDCSDAWHLLLFASYRQRDSISDSCRENFIKWDAILSLSRSVCTRFCSMSHNSQTERAQKTLNVCVRLSPMIIIMMYLICVHERASHYTHHGLQWDSSALINSTNLFATTRTLAVLCCSSFLRNHFPLCFLNRRVFMGVFITANFIIPKAHWIFATHSYFVPNAEWKCVKQRKVFCTESFAAYENSPMLHFWSALRIFMGQESTSPKPSVVLFLMRNAKVDLVDYWRRIASCDCWKRHNRLILFLGTEHLH